MGLLELTTLWTDLFPKERGLLENAFERGSSEQHAFVMWMNRFAKHLGRIEQKLENIDEKLGADHSRLDTLEKDMGEVRQEVTEIKTFCQAVHGGEGQCRESE